MNWEKLHKDILDAITDLDNSQLSQQPKLSKKQRYRLNKRIKTRRNKLVLASQEEEISITEPADPLTITKLQWETNHKSA